MPGLWRWSHSRPSWPTMMLAGGKLERMIQYQELGEHANRTVCERPRSAGVDSMAGVDELSGDMEIWRYGSVPHASVFPARNTEGDII